MRICFSYFHIFDIFAPKHMFLVRFLRIHPVQNVIHSPTQLSGRGFPCIFYIKLIVSQLEVCLCSQMKAGSCIFIIVEIDVQTYVLKYVFRGSILYKAE